jgi:bisphosphoglycerate-dependent phosphoglycerate mutase
MSKPRLQRHPRVLVAAHHAYTALRELIHGIEDGSLDLDYLALDTADPLVADVEAFVKAYHKRYGSRVR